MLILMSAERTFSMTHLYLLTEPAYHKSPWCREILEGLQREARRKRINILSFPADHNTLLPNSAVVLIGSTYSWLQNAVYLCQAQHAHPIVLSNQPQHSFDGEYSSVGIDIASSMKSALEHFRTSSLTHTTLYGVNPRSLADCSRADFFRKYCPNGRVFYNNGSLEKCFEAFLPEQAQFDSVICTNDYAALSLIRRLHEVDPQRAEQLPVISYSSTLLAQYFSFGFTALSMDFEHFGKAAVLIFTALQHTYLSCIQMTVRCTFSNGSHTPVSGPMQEIDPNANPCEPDAFYEDPELQQMLRAEHLLCGCDPIDLTILAGLLDGISYDRLAEQCFLSTNGIKYRVNKMMALCEVHSRTRLAEFVKKFVDRELLPNFPQNAE